MLKNLFFAILLFSCLKLNISLPLKNLRRLVDEEQDFIELTWVKVYNTKHESNNWNFQVVVADDEDLQDGALCLIDIAIFDDGKYSTISKEYCTFAKADHVLNCNKAGTEINYLKMIKFVPNKYYPFTFYSSSYGNVTWKNGNEKLIDIPLNHTFIFTKSYGAFFTDKWNFLISVKNTGNSPKYSKVLVDIFHGTKQTTATCKLLYQGYNNYEEIIFCFSDYDKQTSTDSLKINTEQKHGSIKWQNGLNDGNNEIEKYPDTYKDITLNLKDAYDLYFANDKWFFTILAQDPNSSSRELGKYKVDIGIKKSTDEELTSTADCFLIEGFYIAANNRRPNDIRFICSCEYESQNQDDLITLLYPKSESANINWSTTFAFPYAITLKTSLDLVSSNWDSNNKVLNIDVSGGLLPLNSKDIIDIIYINYNFYNYLQESCIAVSKI